MGNPFSISALKSAKSSAKKPFLYYFLSHIL
jgi:hypothetical protein